MKSLRPWCKHYRGMHEKTECEAGIKFSDLVGRGTPGWFEKCPCFGPGGEACEKSEYPTDEELKAAEEAMNRRFENIGKARAAIVSHLGGPWKKGTPGGSGIIDCQVCGEEESLRFSRAGHNGHIHAGCETDGCVRWME